MNPTKSRARRVAPPTPPDEAESGGAPAATPIDIPRISLSRVEVEIEGVTPLITHAWSAKSKKMMLDAQQQATTTKKAPKNPEQDFQDSRYRLPNGRDGLPATAFKSAIVTAARHFEKITLVALKSAVFVTGEGPEQLVPIVGDAVMREDTVRIASGTADLRYRPVYWPWSATLVIEYVPTVLTATSVVALVDAGGLSGVGEWRPSAPKSFTGSFGRFRVVEG